MQPQAERTPQLRPELAPPPRRKKKPLWWIIASILIVLVAVGITSFVWYQQQTQAVNSDDKSRKVVRIVSGATPSAIADQLKTEGLIRDTRAFALYTRFQGVQNELQAGTYRMSPSESLSQIVEHLTKGTVDTFTITIIPGSTLRDIATVFRQAGYADDEIAAAFAASYRSPLFDGRPAGQDLEGYIYPETYRVGSGATVQAILQQTFDQFTKVVSDNDLVAKFDAQGLSLYEGITMASIIQKEAVGGDEQQIAQVFLSRQAIGMKLGSDPTYQYIADKLGQPRDINFDSPYNTRRYEGLPPGPIANPGFKALSAVANPAPGDYLYFLSGDDNVTYFARTFAEHEQNIEQRCQKKCQYI